MTRKKCGKRLSRCALRAAHAEYLTQLGSFIYYAVGPGTITYDFIYGAHLTELERLDESLGSAIEHQQRLNDAYNAGVE